MKKGFKSLFYKKGLSLVEVLVVLFVSSLIILIATGMMPTVNSLLNSIKSNAHLDILCDTANEYIRGSIQNSSGVSIISYDSLNSVTSGFTLFEKRNDKTFDSNISALAILKNLDNNFRLYDFGNIEDAVQLSNLINSHPDDIYGVFNEAFYCDNEYIITFGSTAPTEGTEGSDGTPPVKGVQGTIKINSQCMSNGKVSNQPRTLTFKVFQGNADFFGTNTTTGMDNGVVILYKENDYTKPKNNSMPNPPLGGEGDSEDNNINYLPTPSPIPNVEDCISVSGHGTVTAESKTSVSSNIIISNTRTGYFSINNIRIVIEAPFDISKIDDGKLQFIAKDFRESISKGQNIQNGEITVSLSDDLKNVTMNFNESILLNTNGTISIQVAVRDWWREIFNVDNQPVTIRVYVNGTEILP